MCGRNTRGVLRTALLAAASLAALGVGAGRAETISGALVKAYLTSPDINTQRAAVRVADENVPKANAGYLPTVEATANIGIERALIAESGAAGAAAATGVTGGGATTSFVKPRG